jgi:hypothetical protein
MGPECNRHILEDHSLFSEFLTEIMVDDLAVILCSDSGENLPLSFGDTEAFEGIFYFFWDGIPRLRVSPSERSCKIVNLREIEILK